MITEGEPARILDGVRGPELTFLGHSTVRIELAGRTVLTDPVLTRGLGPLRRVVPLPDPAAWAGVDVVAISHLHGDHLHLPSLRMLGAGTRILVPRGAGHWLRRRGFTRVEELAPGEAVSDGALRITAVHARHSGHRWGPRLTHGPATRAVGHLVEAGGHTVYAAGDTDLYDGMAHLGARGIDVALLPVWGWGPTLGPGHLDPLRAAQAVALLRPRVAVPVHWGTLALTASRSLRSPARARMARLLVEPPREFAAAVAALGLDTEVLVTEPGHRVAPAPVAAP
jgi:L-ascorbate metabolism protein UlaG (beta-lactamase superfamily)